MEDLIRELDELKASIQTGLYGDDTIPNMLAASTLTLLGKVLASKNAELIDGYAEAQAEFIKLWCDSEEATDNRNVALDGLLGDVDLGEFPIIDENE